MTRSMTLQVFTKGILNAHCFSMLCVITAGICAIFPCYAKEVADQDTKPETSIVPPYCGVYALYMIASDFGIDIPINNLIKPSVVNAYEGSTLAQLEVAARENDLYARSYTGLSLIHLDSSPYPMILHVKKQGADRFNHYVAYLGREGRYIQIYDSNDSTNEIRWMTSDWISAHWDGTALVVSDTPVEASWAMQSWGRGVLVLCLSASLVAIILILLQKILYEHMFANHPHGLACRLINIAILTALSLVFAAIFHLSDKAGYYGEASDVVNMIQAKNAGRFLPNISREGLREAQLAGNVTIVDSRRPADYAKGHIDGAVNIPWNATDEVIDQIISKFENSGFVVVYCSGPSCDFSEIIASRLLDKGIVGIEIYKGGWEQWVEKYTK